jgi:phosphatidylinositol N-acetylglucosaminyltransferase subunit A
VPGLKVYHIPLPTLVSSATLPDFLAFLPYLRTIVLRERITLIHSHASLSSLGHEGVLHAHLLGVRTVFTDHSLFGFADAASILTNKLLEGMLRNVDAAICVSYIGYGRPNTTPASIRKLKISWFICSRENTVLRANLPPKSVYVIPNAIVADHFRPARSKPPTDTSQYSR